ncbi:hypothetical protein GZ77_07175 [Endozoicomonas montiporae]|uniref:Phage tail tape measure protein domain-containing protein n=2 Tax=Endozoicomonas montiporae TaxID=1027273 RepID=A0A081N6Y2_9GAMM|nr:phage tail tape measure protein [Endozoicomonas montiporae]AMO55990.1 phage protein [Endozoicomonas montiporae CL-33]KEQ14205.1 hypothetical protein GZ77_07175 [Endozoicomonas montiporae]
MAATQLEKLMFTIGMVDQISKPIAGVTDKVGELVSTAKSGFADMGVGAAGLIGTGFAIQQMLGPAIEMDRALGEVRSLGVNEDALNKLSAAALDFSTTYGKSATEFVSASYDIQSAIAGLTGDELASFTTNSGLLAAATKADTATITGYMATMYGAFEQSANEMGKANWVDRVTEMTSTAVQMFRTDGNKMSAAFSNLGASATSAGIEMAEQMAILGRLQMTMGGSEAATKYRAFLASAGKAQDALGLQFTDSQGRMLGMVEILDQIRGKYGDTLTVAQSDELAKAFGTQEAVGLIQLLMNDVDGLADSIDALDNVSGLTTATQMAEDMVDPWEQMAAGVEAVRIGMGTALLPVINPLVESMADGAAELSRWTQMFPNLTRVVGLTVVGIVSLGAAMAAVTLIMGVGKTAMAGWMLTMKLVRGLTLLWTAAQWLLNAAFIASPVGLIVIGITALAAILYTAWMGVTALWKAFADTSAGQGLIAFIQEVIGWFGALGEMIGSTINWVIDKVNKIPGVNIGVSEELTAPPSVASLDEGRTLNVPSGGITKQISNAVSNNNGKQIHIGKVETSQQINAHTVEEMLYMAGG